MIKILGLPALGLLYFSMLRVSLADALPGLILLACPTATTAYVMGLELYGDSEFAVAAISASTLLSSASYLFWLLVLSGV